jgi:hypothetical protein
MVSSKNFRRVDDRIVFLSAPKAASLKLVGGVAAMFPAARTFGYYNDRVASWGAPAVSHTRLEVLSSPG